MNEGDGCRVIGAGVTGCQRVGQVVPPYHHERSEQSPYHLSPRLQHLRTIASCRMMRAMNGSVRPTMTSSAIFVISITETTMITAPAGPEGRD
jgi:hypothetical protein